MPRQTTNQEILDEMAGHVADVWVALGRDGVTYASVADHIGKGRSAVQYVFPTAEDLTRAGAQALAKKLGCVMWGEIELNPGAVDAQALAIAEALVWLCRHGGHPFEGRDGLADLEKVE